MSENQETVTAPILQFRYSSTFEQPATVFLFDGNASITMAEVNDFPLQALTLSFWVKTTTTDSTQVLFSYDAVDDDSQRLWIKNPTDLTVGFGSVSTGSTLCSVNDGFWHQISVIVAPADSSHYEVQIYKDGLQVFQSLGLLSHAQGKVLRQGGPLVLGQGIAGEAGFVGQMSEFCLWNTALSDAQIMTQLQIRQTNTPLVLYWSLNSASSVTASGGSIIGGSFVPTPDLRFRQVEALASWTEVTDATYELRVTDSQGCSVFDNATLSSTQYVVPGLLLNTVYQAQVRAFVNGTPGPWSNEAQVTTLLLQSTTLDYDNSTLQTIWNDVDQKEQYVVSLYANQNSTPTTVSPPQTDNTYNIEPQLNSQDTCRIEVQALTAGSYGPGNDVITTINQPTFTLAYNSTNSQNPYLQVQWGALEGADRFYLTVTKQGTSSPALAVLLNASQSPYVITRSQINFQDNEIYDANLRALSTGYIGPWGVTQSVMITELATPQLSFSYTSASNQLHVTWPDIRTQAQKDAQLVVSYNLNLYQNTNLIDQKSDIGNTDAERIYVVSSSSTNRLEIADNFTVKVQGIAPGLTGNWSTPPALTAPAATTFAYHWDNTLTPLQLGWQTATGGTVQYYYYEIVQPSEDAPICAAVVDGTTTTALVSAPVSDGESLLLYARALGEGFITSLGNALPLTVHQILAPTVNSLTANASNHTITVSWTFSDPQVSSPQYQVQLFQGSTSLESATVSDTSKTFNNSQIVAGNSFTVQIQAFQTANYGKLATENITVTDSGVLPQVQGLTCTSNTNGDLSLSWFSVNVNGVLYDLQVLKSDKVSVQYTKSGVDSLSANLLSHDTGVTLGDTYYVQVRATQGNVQGDYSSLCEVKAGIPSSNGGKPAVVVDPVNVATGTYAYTNIDIIVNGVIPLLFATHYATSTPLPTENSFYTGKPIGLRWNHAYNTKIVTSGGKAFILWGSGAVDSYTIPSSITGVYTPVDVPTGDTLFYGSNLVYTLTRSDQTVYTFDSNGNLLQITSPVGNTQTLTYEGQQLQQITDDMSGRFLRLEYNSNQLISKVSDHTGRFTTYTYENGNLKTMQDVMGRTRTFTYTSDSLSLIETIVDQNGITFLKNTYDDQKRVIFQQDGRALQSGATYGATLSYVEDTQAGTVLTTCIDQEGNISEYTSLLANGNLLQSVVYLDEAKTTIRRSVLSYDGFNNVLTRTIYEGVASQADQLQGNTTIYTYDANNNVQTITDPLGQRTTYLYSSTNQLQSYTNALNNTTSYTYSNNLLITESNFLKQTRTFTYKSGSIKGLVDTLTDELNNVYTYDYYANGDLKSITNATGEVLLLTTDDLGCIIQAENRSAQGQTLKTLKLTYSASNLPQTATIWLDNQTEQQAYTYQYEYDNLGNLTKVTNPLGDAISYTYDPNDCLQKITYPTADGSRQETIYTYYKNNLLQEIMYSPQVHEQYTYDALGRLLTHADPENNLTTQTYEMLFTTGRPYSTRVTTTYPQINVSTPAETSEIIVDAADRIISSKNRAGQSTTFTYTTQLDSVTQTNQQVITTMLPLLNGQQSSYTVVTIYDALARQVSYKNEADNVTTTAYTSIAGETPDTFNLVTTVTDPLLNELIATTDPNGRLLSSKRGRDTVTSESSYGYDALGRLLWHRGQYDGTTQDTNYSYSYDASNNSIKVSIGSPEAANTPTVQEYNALDLLIKDDTITRTYNPRGQLFTYQNARLQTLTYTYDETGRFTTVALPDGQKVIHTLDGNGNRVNTYLESVSSSSTANTSQMLITRTFDVFNRMTSRTDNVRNASVSYTYNALDQVHTLTYPDQKQVVYLYDNLGRLQTVTTGWNNRQTSYTYYPVGLIQDITFPNNCTAHYAYDAANNLRSITHTKGDQLIYSVNYTEIDALGNRKTAIVTQPFKPQSNLSSYTDTFTYNHLNQIATVNGQNVTYDDDGNLTNMPAVRSQESLVLLYDIYNRVISANNDSYNYDADGLRVQSAVNGEARQYVYDIRSYVSPGVEQASSEAITGTVSTWTTSGSGILVPLSSATNQPTVPGEALDRVLLIEDGSGNPLYRYVYGNGLISQEQGDGTNLRVYHYDSVGSTIALTDENGGLTDSYTYDPFGKLTGKIGSTANPFLYDGRDGVFTDANGLYYMRARYYQPDYRRFLQKDFLLGNLQNPQTLNRYAYVCGNPITYIDPLGLDKSISRNVWWSVAGGLAVGTAIAATIAGGLAGGQASTITTAVSSGAVLATASEDVAETSVLLTDENAVSQSSLTEGSSAYRRIPFSERFASSSQSVDAVEGQAMPIVRSNTVSSGLGTSPWSRAGKLLINTIRGFLKVKVD